LCDENNPVLLEPMEFPEPVIEIAVEPKKNLTNRKWVKHWEDLQHKIHHLELHLTKSLVKL